MVFYTKLDCIVLLCELPARLHEHFNVLLPLIGELNFQFKISVIRKIQRNSIKLQPLIFRNSVCLVITVTSITNIHVAEQVVGIFEFI